MIAGALNFTLGLQANQFLNSLGVAGGRLLAFTGIATSFAAAFAKMSNAVNQGARLNDLAAAASLSVKDLYQLQRAFEEVGASAEAVPGIVNRLRRTLAGGEQNSLLASLGLDPAALGAMDPAKQFEQIAAALSRLDVNSRANAAFKLLGREGATTMMQIANGAGDFAAAMRQAEADAAVWQSVARTFDQIVDRVVQIGHHIQTQWARASGVVIQAFRDGRLDELIALSFEAGMEKAVQIFNAGLQAMVGMFAATLGNPALWRGFVEAAIASFVHIGTSLSEVLFGPIADLMGDRAGFDARQQARRDYANQQTRDAAESMATGVRSALPSLMSSLREAWASLETGPAGQRFNQFAEELLRRMGQTNPSSRGGPTPFTPVETNPDFGGGGGFGRQNVTEIERMGFIFNRGGFSASDHARNTADNTRRTVTELQRLNEQIGTLTSGAGYENVD